MRSWSVGPLRVAAGIGLAAILLTLGAAASVQAVTNGTIGIRPATESDFFHLTVAPGSTLEEVAVVNNYTDAPVTLLTYVVDGRTTTQGAFALDDQAAIPTTVGLWSALSSRSITVPAQSAVDVPFTITVPANSAPGDYVGGLIIQQPLETGAVSTASDGTATRLDVIHRQGVRIYLTVAGTAVTALTAGVLTWEHTGDTITVSMRVTNTGNTTLKPTGKLTLASTIGKNSSASFDTPEILTPGASITLRAQLSAAGLIHQGTLTGTVSSEATDVSSSTPFLSVRWLILLAIVAGLLVVVFLMWRYLNFLRRARAALARVSRRH